MSETNVHQLPAKDDRILRLPEVSAKVGLKKTAIYDGMKDGTFPKQVKLGKHASGWRESAINAWIASRPTIDPANDPQHHRAA